MMMAPRLCSPGTLVCFRDDHAPLCLSADRICDGARDCNDGRDEQKCPSTIPLTDGNETRSSTPHTAYTVSTVPLTEEKETGSLTPSPVKTVRMGDGNESRSLTPPPVHTAAYRPSKQYTTSRPPLPITTIMNLNETKPFWKPAIPEHSTTSRSLTPPPVHTAAYRPSKQYTTSRPPLPITTIMNLNETKPFWKPAIPEHSTTSRSLTPPPVHTAAYRPSKQYTTSRPPLPITTIMNLNETKPFWKPAIPEHSTTYSSLGTELENIIRTPLGTTGVVTVLLFPAVLCIALCFAYRCKKSRAKRKRTLTAHRQKNTNPTDSTSSEPIYETISESRPKSKFPKVLNSVPSLYKSIPETASPGSCGLSGHRCSSGYCYGDFVTSRIPEGFELATLATSGEHFSETMEVMPGGDKDARHSSYAEVVAFQRESQEDTISYELPLQQPYLVSPQIQQKYMSLSGATMKHGGSSEYEPLIHTGVSPVQINVSYSGDACITEQEHIGIVNSVVETKCDEMVTGGIMEKECSKSNNLHPMNDSIRSTEQYEDALKYLHTLRDTLDVVKQDKGAIHFLNKSRDVANQDENDDDYLHPLNHSNNIAEQDEHYNEDLQQVNNSRDVTEHAEKNDNSINEPKDETEQNNSERNYLHPPNTSNDVLKQDERACYSVQPPKDSMNVTEQDEHDNDYLHPITDSMDVTEQNDCSSNYLHPIHFSTNVFKQDERLSNSLVPRNDSMDVIDLHTGNTCLP